MRKALEDLVFLGQMEDTFTLLGKSWRIATISSDDQLSATSRTSSYDNLARLNALKIEILAFALKQVDKTELNDPDETGEFVRKLPQPIINAIFEKYENLATKQAEALQEVEELKN